MLGVDGYTVRWGADISDFERGSDRMRRRTRLDADHFRREWDLASEKATQRMFGFKNLGMAAIGGVAASVALATKGVREYAKVNKAVADDLDGLSGAVTGLFQDIGRDASVAIGPITDVVNLLRDARNFMTDVFQGSGAAATHAQAIQERHAQDAAIAARAKMQQRFDESVEYEPNSLSKADALRAQHERRMALIYREADDLREQARGRGDATASRAEMDRIARWVDAESRKSYAPVMAVYEAIEAEKERLALVAERNRLEEEAISRRRQDEQDARDAERRMDEDYVRNAGAMAAIERLRADGRAREADEAKIRLDAERDVQEVMERENVGLIERLDAVEAIAAARDARLDWLNRPERQITSTLESGLVGARASFLPQVFGGPNSVLGVQTSIAESSLKVLEKIERNTSGSHVGVVGP